MRRVIILSALLFASATGTPAAARPTREATVVRVDDGDTIDIRLGHRVERVRYLGMDAPEISHCGVGGERGGVEAARLNASLVSGRRVRLELDLKARDRYGRLLAYVWVGDTMVNLDMVRRGYARALTIPPNVRYEGWFVTAELEARVAARGLWGSGALERPRPAIAGPAPRPPARQVTSCAARARVSRGLLPGVRSPPVASPLMRAARLVQRHRPPRPPPALA